MDLNEPLGTTPMPRRKRRLGLLLGLAMSVPLGGALAYFILNANPRGGEPYVIATIARPPPKLVAKQQTPTLASDPMPTGSMPTGSTLQNALASSQAPTDAESYEGGVKVFRGKVPGSSAAITALKVTALQSDASGSKPLIIDVSRALDGAKRPASEIVPRFPAAGSSAAKPTPRIAIFIGGMGLAADATRTAIDTLPPAVTLAFVPNGEGVAKAVEAARAKGHEVLVQLPMQSGDMAGLGPHSLRADTSSAALNADIDWLMTRFKGYDGVTNLLGAPVTSKAAAMTAVLKAVGGRGLFFVDDGTSRRNLAVSLAPGLGVPAMATDVVLDATADPAVVRANFDSLVAAARRKGTAIGMASGLPEHLAAIGRYASELGSQGITLVPVGALVRGTGPDVAAR